MKKDVDGPSADIEVAGGLRAGEATWHERSTVRVVTVASMEKEEERDRSPEKPVPGRRYRDVLVGWRLRAGVTHRKPSA